MTKVKTLVEGKDSQPGRNREQMTGHRQRQVWGQRGVQGTEVQQGSQMDPAWAQATEPGVGRRSVVPEQSGDFLRARLESGPGWPIPWGDLPLGIPSGWCGGARYSLLDGSGVVADKPGVSCPPQAGAGTLGDLAGGGAGPQRQLLPLMSQGHE